MPRLLPAIAAALGVSAALTLAQAPKTPELHPPIAIAFTLKEPGFVTLVVDDATGHRVRNLLGDTVFPAGANVAYWDGLDDLGRDPEAAAHAVYHIPGKLVTPGSYIVRGLVHPKIDLRYEMTPYFPGNPPWLTKDRSSGWLTNHTPPSAVLWVPPGAAPAREGKPTSSGAQFLVGSWVSEGGSGLAWLDSTGQKLHGQEWVGGVWTGVTHLARDAGEHPVPGVYAYTAAPWDDELRLAELVGTGANAPRDGRMGAGGDRPLLSPVWKFHGPERYNDHSNLRGVGGLAVRDGLLVASLPLRNELLFIDARERQALGTAHLEAPGGLAFESDGHLLALSGDKLLRLTLPANLAPYLTSDPAHGVPLDRRAWKASATKHPEQASRAIDGDPATRWDTGGEMAVGDAFMLDLGAPRAFFKVTLSVAAKDDYPRECELYTSQDGAEWGAPLAKFKGTTDRTVLVLPQTTARFLKIVQTGKAGNYWSIDEISVEEKPVAVPLAALPLSSATVVAKGLDEPQQLALDASGNIFVSDWGASHQVKVFTASGKLLRAIGEPGKPALGAYDPRHMHNPNGLTLTPEGELWVAETDRTPKRLSVWTAEGKFVRAYYGPPAYGGGGWLDGEDKTRYFYADMAEGAANKPGPGGTLELKLDWEHGIDAPAAVLYRPELDTVKVGGHPIPPETPMHAGGRTYLTNAHNSNPTNGTETAVLWLVENGAARPVAGIGQANRWGLLNETAQFSARWSGVVEPKSTGTHTITVHGEDGVRLWVNEQKVLDRWYHGDKDETVSVPLEAGKPVGMRLEFKQRSGDARVRLSWKPGDAGLEPIRPAGGWNGEYFRDTDLHEPLEQRLDAQIDFNFGQQGLKLSTPNPFANRLPAGATFNNDRITFAWSDLNDDGAVQPEEITMRVGAVGSVNLQPDLSAVTGSGLLVKPQGFTKGGAPIYDLAQATELGPKTQGTVSSGGGQALVDRQGRFVFTTAPKPFSPYGFGGGDHGEAKWSYPSMWPGLHASHGAPLAEQPGEVIGTTRLIGGTVTPRGSDVGELWAINGNKGQVHLFTTDGLFATTLFRDSRTAGWNMPAARRGMSVAENSLGEESFWPAIQQTSDGQIYLLGNGSLLHVTELEGMRAIPPQPLEVTPPMLAAATAYFSESEARRQAEIGPGSLTVALRQAAPVVDGKLDDWAGAAWVTIDERTQQVGDWGSRKVSTKATVCVAGDRLYAAFRTDDAKLLNNSGELLPNLFKFGGALDLMLGTAAPADPKRRQAVAGDVRLLVTRVKEKTVAVLYRPVAPGAHVEPVAFTSPQRTIKFDEVREVSDQVQLASGTERDEKAKSENATFEFSIPMEILGLQPRADLVLSGDLGILRGNGFQTMQRVYWNNKASGIVSDVPSEAELQPLLWGKWKFKAQP